MELQGSGHNYVKVVRLFGGNQRKYLHKSDTSCFFSYHCLHFKSKCRLGLDRCDRWRISSIPKGLGYLIIYGFQVFNFTFEALSNFDDNEMYDPVTNTWTKLLQTLMKRSGLASATVGNDIDVLAGQSVNGTFNTNEKYNTKNNTWTTEPPSFQHHD